MSGFIEVDRDDLRRLNRLVRRSVDNDLPRRMGEANRSIGRLVISLLHPPPNELAVGRGAGAAIRPSASKREVLLRVGGKHRAGKAEDGQPKSPRMQWGRRPVHPFRRKPARPHIRGTVDRHEHKIREAWTDAVIKAMSGPFDTE